MAQGKTHYDVLGLARDAPVEDIEANYRLKLSQLKGRAGVSAADVMALRVAHQALADPARRAAYDKSLAAPPRVRATFTSTPPKLVGPDTSWWQSTPAMVAGLVVAVGIGAWGWNNWQKKAASPQRRPAPAAAMKPMPPNVAPRGAPSAAKPASTPATAKPAPTPAAAKPASGK